VDYPVIPSFVALASSGIGEIASRGQRSENIARIPAVQALFDQFNVTPTYQVLRVPEIAGGRLVPSAFTAWSP